MDSPQSGTITLQKIIAILMSCVLLASLVIWVVTNRPHPRILRIATAEPGGLYHRLGQELQPYLAEASGRKLDEIKIERTHGSPDNYELLITQQVEAFGFWLCIQSRADAASLSSPMPLSNSPWLRPTPRKLKRSTAKPRFTKR